MHDELSSLHNACWLEWNLRENFMPRQLYIILEFFQILRTVCNLHHELSCMKRGKLFDFN